MISSQKLPEKIFQLTISLRRLREEVIMEFCPTCANMLRYEPANVGRRARLFCLTCPYICKLENEVVLKKPLRLPKKPPVESVDITASNERAKELAPKAEVTCPKCKSGKAYFEQHQTRSADEPMTIFYRCCNENCKHQWRED